MRLNMATSMRKFRSVKQLFEKFRSHTRCPCVDLEQIKPLNQARYFRTFFSGGHSNLGHSNNLKYFLTGVASFGLGGCAVFFGSRYDNQLKSCEVVAAEPFDGDGAGSPPSLKQRWGFIADVVEKTSPALVYIELKGRHPFTGQMIAMSNGSGFLIREDGLILTNAHVVANKQSVKVRLKDGRTFNGTVQAVDPVSDLATLKISAKNLPTIKLGKSSEMRPGDWVVALGSPFQLSNTVTAGIISSINRESKELGLAKDMEYIQTDAVINFGNSGGPLVNLDGEAIGINTMKVTAGISFAIPSDYIQQFLDKARTIEKRAESRGWFSSGTNESPSVRRYIGLTLLTLTPAILPQLRALGDFFPPDIDKGVLVHKVVVGSPAHEGGLQPMDVILQINGKNITSSADVYKSVETEQELEMTVQRGRSKMVLTVRPEGVE